LPKGKARQGFFEHEEFQAILKHLLPHLIGIARFAYLTGWPRRKF
jgi:hypothetical protein